MSDGKRPATDVTGATTGLIHAGRLTTLDSLVDLGARAAALLLRAGVQPGDSVALLLRNGRAFLEATLGAQHLGAYPVPVNWHFTRNEIEYLLDDCGARVVIADADLADAVADALSNRTVFTVGGASDRDWDAAVAATDPLTAPAQPAPQSMIYTSGTTGRPKGVRRAAGTAAQAAEAALTRKRIYETKSGMRVLLAAPLYHAAPNFFALSTIRNHGLLVLEDRFDAAATLTLIEQHRITHSFMVPTMFVRLLALPDAVRAAFDPSSLHWVLHAGAPCPPDVKRAMIRWWGPVLKEYYGSTEAGPLTFVDSAQWLEHEGTVGRAIEGVVLSIRDPAGKPCPPGVAGEVCIGRTAQPDYTYHGDDAKRRAADVAGGLATGDIGYLDGDGYLFLCDRKTDLIISGGVNIYPAEIEAAIHGVPGIRDVAVIGVPDAEFGEAVVAVLEPEPDGAPDAAAVFASLRGRIANYKMPRRIIFTDHLPRDDSGKIFKRKLRDALLDLGGTP